MDKRQLSHDILNILERLRIMHDIARDENYDAIPKDELKADLKDSLRQLEEAFKELIQ